MTPSNDSASTPSPQRPIWKGALCIERLQIPVKVFPATSDSATISFNQLHEVCQSRVKQLRWCPKCEREVPMSEIIKGFEFETGHYVMVGDAEFDAVKPTSTREITLTQFAPRAALPLVALDRAYFLEPIGQEATDAYLLVVDVLARLLTGAVGIGKLGIYGREYLVAVLPVDGALMLFTLHPARELRTAPTLAPARRLPVEQRALREIVSARVQPLDLSTFVDEHQADLQRLIDAKIAGEDYVQAPVEAAAVLSLSEALAQSLMDLP